MTSLLSTPANVTTPSSKIAPATAAKDAPQASLTHNYNDFLKLLMTQLKNQDPTSPMDTNQFTSQLVQYSSVEQQIATNTSLTQLIQLTQGGEVLQSSSLVGKPVTVTSDRIALQGGKGDLQFDTATSQPVSIGIYSDAGVKLRDAVVNSQPGHNAWAWDGKDSQGSVVPDGAYRAIVSGQSGGVAHDLPFTVSGTATGVQKSGNALQVELGALKVDLSAVQSLAP